MIQDKKSYLNKMADQLIKFDNDIKELRKKASDKKGQAIQEYDELLRELQLKNDDAKAKLKNLNEATSEAWDTLKSGMDNAIGEVSKSFSRAAEKFKNK